MIVLFVLLGVEVDALGLAQIYLLKWIFGREGVGAGDGQGVEKISL